MMVQEKPGAYSDQIMRIVVRMVTAAALATSLLAGPAFAQMQMGDKQKTGPQLEDEARAKRNAEIDKEYRRMRQHTEDSSKVTKVDPWQNMRAPTVDANR
jgi:hypothetical protein